MDNIENIKEDLFYVAMITTAHGIKGELKVSNLSDQPDRLEDLDEVFVVSADEEQVLGEYKIKSLRGAQKNILKLEGIDDRDQALALKGCFLAVLREDALDLKKGEYYVQDIIGFKAIDAKTNEDLGIITDVLTAGGSKLLEVKRLGKKDLYIPTYPGVAKEVNLEEEYILFDLPKGLLEVYQ